MSEQAYWDALPFIGYHRPDFIRITDGKFRNPEVRSDDFNDRSYELSLERKAKLAVQKLETAERHEAKRLARMQENAKRKQELQAVKEQLALKNKETDAEKRARWAEMQAKRKKDAEDRIAARAVAKMLGLPKPAPKHKPKVYTSEQMEARRERAREWARAHRTPGDPARKARPVKVTKADGTVIVYPSISQCCLAENHDKTILRGYLAKGVPHTYPNGNTVEYAGT